MDAKALGAQPAHPMPVGVQMTNEGTYRANPLDGLTKREAFAMATLCSPRNPVPCVDHAASARWALSEADALLAELAKEPQP